MKLVLEHLHLRPDPRPRTQFHTLSQRTHFSRPHRVPHLYLPCFHPLRIEPRHSK